MAILGMRDDIQNLSNIWVATDTREPDQGCVGCVGRDVVLADPQHLDSFSGRSPARTIPPYERVEVIQLSGIYGAVFSKGHAGHVCLFAHTLGRRLRTRITEGGVQPCER